MVTLTALEETLAEIGARIARGQAAIAQRQAQDQEVPHDWTDYLARLQHAQRILALRSKLAALRARLDKGMEVLAAKQEAGQINKLWYETWERLLREYEETADKLAELTLCPIGDCRHYESCTTKPAPCPAVRA